MSRRAGANEGAQQSRGQCWGAVPLSWLSRRSCVLALGIKYLKGSSPLTNTTNSSAGSMGKRGLWRLDWKTFSGPFQPKLSSQPLRWGSVSCWAVRFPKTGSQEFLASEPHRQLPLLPLLPERSGRLRRQGGVWLCSPSDLPVNQAKLLMHYLFQEKQAQAFDFHSES